jgi:hypothetical protein
MTSIDYVETFYNGRCRHSARTHASLNDSRYWPELALRFSKLS